MSMPTELKSFEQIVRDGFSLKSKWPNWDLKLILNDDNCSYLLMNHSTREAVWTDPMREDWETHSQETRKLLNQGYRFLAVFDSHTHADHISNAAQLAELSRAPLVMSERAPSRRVDLRVSRDTCLSSAAAPVHLLVTPGHTADSLTLIWGPFIMGADTILYGDTGRDDLPGGDPVAHYESLQKIKKFASNDMILLPGHDSEGGRASSWFTQLDVNPTLTQDRETFVREAEAYVGPAPKILKESLFENFK